MAEIQNFSQISFSKRKTHTETKRGLYQILSSHSGKQSRNPNPKPPVREGRKREEGNGEEHTRGMVNGGEGWIYFFSFFHVWHFFPLSPSSLSFPPPLFSFISDAYGLANMRKGQVPQPPIYCFWSYQDEKGANAMDLTKMRKGQLLWIFPRWERGQMTHDKHQCLDLSLIIKKSPWPFLT